VDNLPGRNFLAPPVQQGSRLKLCFLECSLHFLDAQHAATVQIIVDAKLHVVIRTIREQRNTFPAWESMHPTIPTSGGLALRQIIDFRAPRSNWTQELAARRANRTAQPQLGWLF